MQVAPGPQGDGLHGSGFSTHFWFWQTYPVLQSGSRTHSGPQPVMVSGFGTRPGSHLEATLRYVRVSFIPYGLVLQSENFLPADGISKVINHTVLQSGSRTHSGPQPVMVSGLGTRPGSHLKKCKRMPRVNFRTDSKSTSYYIQCCPLSV